MAQTGPLPPGSLPQGQVPPGPPLRGPRHRSFVGPILLIVLGVLFLGLNFYPDFDPWPILARYWPGGADCDSGVGENMGQLSLSRAPGRVRGIPQFGNGDQSGFWLVLVLFSWSQHGITSGITTIGGIAGPKRTAHGTSGSPRQPGNLIPPAHHKSKDRTTRYSIAPRTLVGFDRGAGLR